jgi:pimeloyl-ACP methyl ester carboxylesterase
VPRGLPVGVAERTARVGEASFRYLEAGEGPVLLLLHGWPETAESWSRMMPALATRYRVIAPDLPGLGGSSPPPAYTKKAAAQHLHEFVVSLGLQRPRVAGHDYGAAVAYAYAAQYPGEVEQLVLMEAPLADDAFLQSPTLADDPRQTLWHVLFNNVDGLAETLVTGQEREYLTWFLREFSYDPDSFARAFPEEELSIYIRAYQEPGRMQASFEYVRAYVQDVEDNRTLSQQRLPMPVLTVAGEVTGGQNHPLAAQMRAWAQNTRHVVIPRSGHWIPDEQPDALTAELQRFFDDGR